MHSSRMRAARSLPYRGVSVWGVSVRETPLDKDQRHGTRDRDPLEGTWDQVARQEVHIIQRPPIPVNRTTDRQV